MAALWEEIVRGGASWSHILKRGTTLRMIDLEGGANAGVLLYNTHNTTERLNVPDTLKAQHTAKLTTGYVLYSDMGRILCSVIGDTCGWHDPIAGNSNAASAEARYGASSYQEQGNDYVKNGRDAFLIELGKLGMDARDLVPSVNFFSKVAVNRDGTMAYVVGNSSKDSLVELRAEMDTLVVLHTCPHPLDPATKYAPKPVHLSIRTTAQPGPEDPCRIQCPENERGFILTERYHL